jgi:RNA polymerase sigma-70 factor (ECF subfamily)
VTAGSHGDDPDLARRIRAGESGAEELLCRRFEPGLRAIALVRAGRSVAADLVQEALILALGNLREGKWRGEGTLAAYLASILRHLVARSGRRRQPGTGKADLDALPAGRGDPHAAASRFEDLQRVRHALLQLSGEHREVVLRHYFEEQSVGRIAGELGIPRGTVLSRLHYARRMIARHLNRQDLRGHATGRTKR